MYKLNLENFDRLPEHKQDEILDALEALDNLKKSNPLVIYNNPIFRTHAKQLRFHQMVKDSGALGVNMLLGGNQSGKTTSGLADDIIQALPEDVVPEHLRKYKKFQPPFLARIFAPSDAQLETVTYEKLKELLPPSELMGGSWSKAYTKDLRILHFRCGSKFFFNTYRQEVSVLGGSTLDRIHYDEEPPKDIRTESRIRIVRREGDEIFTMTPTEGMTWMADDYWDALEEHPIGGDAYEVELLQEGASHPVTIRAITVDMDDNPWLTEAAKATVLEGLSKEQRIARKQGKFVALHGTIYGDFNTHRHVWPEMGPDELPEAATIVVGIDPGIRNRCGVVWMYVTPEDQMVVFEEGYYEAMTAGEVSKEIHKINGHYGIQPNYYVIDPTTRNKEHVTGRSVQMEYADHGIVAIAGQNDVRAGINRVKERLERTLDASTEEGFWVTDNCPNLIREMKKYRWRKPSQTEDDPKEAPVKKDDHLLDALRYAVMSRPYLPALQHRNDETELERAVRLGRQGRSKGHMARVGT